MDRNADGFGHALSARVGKGFELLDAEAVKTDPPGRRIRRLNGDIQTRLGTGMLKGLNNRLVKDRLQNKRAGLGHGRAPGDPMQVCLAGKERYSERLRTKSRISIRSMETTGVSTLWANRFICRMVVNPR